MRLGVVLFTRDLRVHDQPALCEALARCEQVVPLFVFDRDLRPFLAPNRVAFLLDALRDLRRSLRRRGGTLAVRSGDVVDETLRVALELGAEAVYLSEDVSAYARAREQRLRRACATERIALRACPGVTVVPPGDLVPAGGDHFRVFTPYWRRWRSAARRRVLAAPRRVSVPRSLSAGRLPASCDLVAGSPSPRLPAGGEQAGRERLARWLRTGLRDYGRLHDDLAADATSRLSADLHFGCLSPLEVVERAERGAGAEPFVRQLAWRDFFAQLLAANPETARRDLRARGVRWRRDDAALEAWRAGRTGYPLVDAGMRQLRDEGWMHNRARLVAGSFLTKQLGLDWRLGARHFFELLVDGDVASNVGNWQWVAGTGADTRPGRIFNPVAQGRRHDPDGAYVRRHVPELAHVEGARIHEPWRLDDGRPAGYPDPIVDHAEAAERFRRARARAARG